MSRFTLPNCAMSVLLAAGFGALAMAGDSGGARKEPVKIIFDTDMYTDFDDAGALACLHALADAGECEILATVANTRDCLSVAMCEIINSYYGRPGIPVGCSKEVGVSGSTPRHLRRYQKTVEKYRNWVRHMNSDSAPDANEVYRRILATQEDQSVVICSVGFLTNMRRLLETKGDSISPLDGKTLVLKKVKTWVAMACSYPAGREHNAMMDHESSRIALSEWPTPVIFTDFQYGLDCFAGRALAESKSKDNPVAEVFAGSIPSRREIRRKAASYLRGGYGMAGRAAWDQTAVLIAVRGTDGYFNSTRGKYSMSADEPKENEWTPDIKGGPHRRITEKIPKERIGRIIDELTLRSPRLGLGLKTAK